MPKSIRTRGFSRRHFLTASAAAAALTLARPYLSRASDRPFVTHGVQSGDVSATSGVVWARADRPARMLVEASTTESFRDIVAGTVADVLPETDFTGKVLLDDLPAGQDIFYRIRFQDLSAPTILGEPAVGRFRTAPDERRSVSFVWSGDTCGQGWGIDEARGGFRTYAAMLRNEPDFFIHSGDSIYADCINPPGLKLPDGTIWKNLVTEEKSRTAETLADYRGNYKYNLLDTNVRAFNAQVPALAQWDDHEVTNDWWPGLPLDRDLGYDATNAMLLAARGARAFREFMPMRESMAEPGRVYRKIPYGPLLDVFMLDMRSYRGANGETDRELGSHFLGPRQVAWLKRELSRSRAVWKVIAADMPLGLILGGEAIAEGDGPPVGRESEIADLLSFMKRNAIRNTVWLTADVHYTAAHHYDPNAAVFQDFEPFWEFVSGPLHAGTWPPLHARQHIRSTRRLPGGLQRGAGRESRALFWAAILRACPNRRRDGRHDRHPEGRRGPGVVGGHHPASARRPAGFGRVSGLTCRPSWRFSAEIRLLTVRR